MIKTVHPLMPSGDVLNAEVFSALHKVTVEDDLLDQKGDESELATDLRLGVNDFIWLAGRLSQLSQGHGGTALFPSEISSCETAGDLVTKYEKAVKGKQTSLSVAKGTKSKRGQK